MKMYRLVVTHLEQESPEELERRSNKCGYPRGNYEATSDHLSDYKQIEVLTVMLTTEQYDAVKRAILQCWE